MNRPTEATLFVAHPGHELLVHGWLRRMRPVVHVLTDGSGHSSAPRLSATTALLRESGARSGAICGRLSDREAYALIRERDVQLLASIVDDLAEELAARRVAVAVCDAAEGYNPVHELSRMIVGAAIAAAGAETTLYEYAVVGPPDAFDGDGVVRLQLDDAAFEEKMLAAERFAPTITDVGVLLERHGREAYRTESFRPVADWTALHPSERPDYERYGEERVAGRRYDSVIRRREHMAPLRDALCAWVENGQVVS